MDPDRPSRENGEPAGDDIEQHLLMSQDDIDEDYGPYRYRSPLFKGIAILVVLAFLALALPGLIHLFSAKNTLRQDPALDSDMLAQSAKSAIVVVQARTENGLAVEGKKGTGFNIRSDGAVITNEHVVSGAFSVSVLFEDGRVFFTNRWERVGDADLVILDIRAENCPVLPLEDYLPQSGQMVTVIGNPLHTERLVQKGQIKTVTVYAQGGGRSCFEIMVTALPGISGSPVIDDKGAVIGVVYASRGGPDTQSDKTALAIPLAAVGADLQSALKRLEQPTIDDRE